jgi:low temperature requirement protein LtrA
MADGAPRGYLRDREDEDSARVSFVELFYDLVFVFAVTQLAAYLAENLSVEGLARTLVLFLAVWWLWINTTWALNRLDPDRSLVRGVIFVMMGAGLMLTVSIPQAFGDRALVFAVAYVTMQVGRSLFMVWALGHAGERDQQRTFMRNAVWFLVSGVFWIAGAIVQGELEVVLWSIALLIELGVPWIGYRVPGLGSSTSQAWDVEGEHLTERCGLFIILSLGESILVTGSRMTPLEMNAVNVTAFAVAILGSLVMWWIYFDTGARRGTKAFERAEEPGRLARFAYTYVHLPIVAGVVVVAVSDKLLLAHPEDRPDVMSALIILGGPAMFLLGNFLFKNAISRRWPLSHVVGLALLTVPIPWLGAFSLMALVGWTVASMVAVAILERVFLRSKEAARVGVN